MKVVTPRFGFGTSNREHSARIFVSDMHAKSGAAVAYAPRLANLRLVRPSARLLAYVGSSPHSLHLPPPVTHSASPRYATSPGPGVYSLNSSIGAQATSRGRSAPSWGFGKATRFDNRAYTTDTPGPGSYAT